MVTLDATKSRKTDKSEFNLAGPLPSRYHLRNGRSDDSEPRRNRNRSPDDPHFDPRLRRLHHVEE